MSFANENCELRTDLVKKEDINLILSILLVYKIIKIIIFSDNNSFTNDY